MTLAVNTSELQVAEPHVVDVAEYILKTYGAMQAMRLQQLCYYVQAWSLAWDRGQAFPEQIEAWSEGPVIRELLERYTGLYKVDTVGGDAGVVAADPRLCATIEEVVNYYYKSFSEQQLTDLIHVEKPWLKSRAAIAAPGAASQPVIGLDLMREYYQSLMARAQSVAVQA